MEKFFNSILEKLSPVLKPPRHRFAAQDRSPGDYDTTGFFPVVSQ
jgi:hypothetical protein